MNPFERFFRALDHAQRNFGPAAFIFGVVKKYGDDRGGNLTALITYYGFLSVFPLLLVLVTVLGIIGGSSSSTTESIRHSALAQFPVIGSQLGRNIHELHRRSVIGLIIGILGLIYGSQGASQSGQFAMAEIWNVPAVSRPNYWARLGRSMVLMATLGVFLIVSTALAGFSSFYGGHSPILRWVFVLLTLVADVVLYLFAFRLLTPKSVGSRVLIPGAVAGGIGWTILQLLGAFIIDHTLRNTSQVYGFFAVVFGLLAWIALGAQMTLYCAEVNVVLHRRLWPRGLVQPPLTEADERVYASIVKQSPRRPEVKVSVHPNPERQSTETGDQVAPADQAAPAPVDASASS